MPAQCVTKPNEWSTYPNQLLVQKCTNQSYASKHDIHKIYRAARLQQDSRMQANQTDCNMQTVQMSMHCLTHACPNWHMQDRNPADDIYSKDDMQHVTTHNWLPPNLSPTALVNNGTDCKAMLHTINHAPCTWCSHDTNVCHATAVQKLIQLLMH